MRANAPKVATSRLSRVQNTDVYPSDSNQSAST